MEPLDTDCVEEKISLSITSDGEGIEVEIAGNYAQLTLNEALDFAAAVIAHVRHAKED